MIRLSSGREAQSEGYGYALQAALHLGYEALVRLLIDKGSDINTDVGLHGNELQEASSEDFEAIARLLVAT